MNFVPDTIAAIATPPGRGGISVIRISGPLSTRIIREVLRSAILTPRVASIFPFTMLMMKSLIKASQFIFLIPIHLLAKMFSNCKAMVVQWSWIFYCSAF